MLLIFQTVVAVNPSFQLKTPVEGCGLHGVETYGGPTVQAVNVGKFSKPSPKFGPVNLEFSFWTNTLL